MHFECVNKIFVWATNQQHSSNNFFNMFALPSVVKREIPQTQTRDVLRPNSNCM